MGELQIGDRAVDTDLRRWEPDLRRDASLVVGALAGVLLLVALVYYALNAAGSGWFLWVAIVLLAVLLVVELAVLVTGIAREENVGPPWLAGAETAEASTTSAGATVGPDAEEQPDAEPAAVHEHPEIDLQCPACEDMFTVEDTGERPLATQCPHCGAQGHVNLPEPEEHEDAHGHERGHGSAAGAGAATQAGGEDPLAGLGEEDADEAEAPPEDVETISLQCPACETEFETEDTGERPLRTECPGCGKSGKLG